MPIAHPDQWREELRKVALQLPTPTLEDIRVMALYLLEIHDQLYPDVLRDARERLEGKR